MLQALKIEPPCTPWRPSRGAPDRTFGRQPNPGRPIEVGEGPAYGRPQGGAVAACYRQAITDTLLRAQVMELQIVLKARLGHGRQRRA
jgi:hypothetical protein